jgi:hypothetical protein
MRTVISPLPHTYLWLGILSTLPFVPYCIHYFICLLDGGSGLAVLRCGLLISSSVRRVALIYESFLQLTVGGFEPLHSFCRVKIN